MIKVKLTFPYPKFLLLRQFPGYSAQWNNYQFFINQDIPESDFWFIFGYVPKAEETYCSKDNLVFIGGEPSSIQTFSEDYLKQFSWIITCQEEIQLPNTIHYLNGQHWFVNKSYDELLNMEEVEKNKLISIVISNKRFTPGHQKRYDFAMALKKYFGDILDLYGRGINGFNDKWDVLAPYKYSIAIENSPFNDYITEKLFDCYLSHTFPLYYGCPNITQYFSNDSFALIDINDFHSSIKIIEDIINNKSHYEQHLESLKQAKLQCLNEYNLFPLIVKMIETRIHPLGNENKIKLTIYPEKIFKKKSKILIPTHIWEKIFKKNPR